MRTYYDPEDDSFCDKTDRHERLLDLADHLRDEAKDREMEESYNNFTAPSGAAETSPVAMLPADHATTLWGVGDVDAAGEEPISTKPRHEYSQTARALLTRCFKVMSGPEINACQIATGDYDTDEGFNATIIDLLAIQYSREISEHIN
jgi:hypothetical protein